MNLAAEINSVFTVGAPRKVVYKASQPGLSSPRSLGLNPAFAAPYGPNAASANWDPLWAVTLEHQRDLFRVFHKLTGQLLYSHYFRLEAIRMAEMAGYHFVR